MQGDTFKKIFFPLTEIQILSIQYFIWKIYDREGNWAIPWASRLGSCLSWVTWNLIFLKLKHSYITFPFPVPPPSPTKAPPFKASHTSFTHSLLSWWSLFILWDVYHIHIHQYINAVCWVHSLWLVCIGFQGYFVSDKQLEDQSLRELFKSLPLVFDLSFSPGSH